jgi:hypothetical protein
MERPGEGRTERLGMGLAGRGLPGNGLAAPANPREQPSAINIDLDLFMAEDKSNRLLYRTLFCRPYFTTTVVKQQKPAEFGLE